MDSRRVARTAVAAGVALGTGIATLTLGQGAGVAAATDLDDLVLKAVVQSEKDFDTGRKGESAGDSFVFSEKLFDFESKRRVGTSSVECLLTYVKRNANGKVVDGAGHCEGALILKDGQITLAAGFTFDDEDEDFRVAITGGTEDYSGATGQMRVKDINAKASKLTLEFEDSDDRNGTVVGPLG